jgi:hypothetical protein
LVLGGFAVGKLVGIALLAVALVHPVFSWARARARPGSAVVLVDRTESMQFRAAAREALLAKLPAGERVNFEGGTTGLGDALLALTNRLVLPVILLSDGQHNQGVGPAWAAARLGVPVFAVGVGDPVPPRDVALEGVEAPDLVVSGDVAVVTGAVFAPGYDGEPIPARIVDATQVLVATNAGAGEWSVQFTPKHSGVYALKLAPVPGEVTTDNNRRPFAVTVLPGRIRVFLQHEKPDWEFRHVRHALGRDPAVALVDRQEEADVVLATSGQTWRWEALGDDVFQRYWSGRVRDEYLRTRNVPRPEPVVVSEEMYRLWRNDELLRELARVSGGRFFTADTISELPAALRADRPGDRRRFDLRDSWLVLLATAAAFMVSWARCRSSSETA